MDIVLSVSAVENLGAFQLNLVYNSTQLTYSGCTKGTALANAFSASLNASPAPGRVTHEEPLKEIWISAVTPDQPITYAAQTVLYTLHFTAASDLTGAPSLEIFYSRFSEWDPETNAIIEHIGEATENGVVFWKET